MECSSGPVEIAIREPASPLPTGVVTDAVVPPLNRRAARVRAGIRAVALYRITLFIVVTVVFALPRAMPGDALATRQDPTDSLYVSDAKTRAHLLAYYGLDKPLIVQYGKYLVRVSHGDLGWSIANNTKVTKLIREHLPWTLLLMGTSLAISSFISFLAGVTAAWRR